MLEDLYELAKNGANFNICDENGTTPLMSASKKDDVEVIKFLIKHIDRVDQKDHFNHTALYYAVSVNNVEVVKTLYTGGAKVTDDIYMLAVYNDFKQIVNFFDIQDKDKRFMLNKR